MGSLETQATLGTERTQTNKTKQSDARPLKTILNA